MLLGNKMDLAWFLLQKVKANGDTILRGDERV